MLHIYKSSAGSGKTYTLVKEYLRLAFTSPPQPGSSSENISYPHILAITFTNKAAGEMRERIFSLGVSGRMWVHTFHSLCARLLREYASAAGINPNYTIFDESDRRALLREVIADCGLSVENWPPRATEQAISSAKNRMLTP